MAHEIKSLSIKEKKHGQIIVITITGKLEKEDYEHFVPELERLMQSYDKIRMLVELVDFEGWSVAAAWEDTKFGLRHFNDIERLAFVGDKQWEQGLAAFCKVFTTADVRYFDASKKEDAILWIAEGIREAA